MLVDRNRLYHHVQRLTVVPRPAETPALEETRQYVTAELEAAGWDVHRHEFNARNENGRALKGINLVCTHEGQEPRSDVRFCVGAHLDSREETPGADDNASAVAALLEIARLLPQQWPANAAYELELVVFDLEEHGMLGGAEHARLSKLRPFDLASRVSLEMLW